MRNLQQRPPARSRTGFDGGPVRFGCAGRPDRRDDYGHGPWLRVGLTVVMTSRSFDRYAIRVVEAAYRIERGLDEWLAEVLRAATKLLDGDKGYCAYIYRVEKDGHIRITSSPHHPGFSTGDTKEGLDYARRTPPALVRPMFVFDPPVVNFHSLWSQMPHEHFPDYQPFDSMARSDIRDCVVVRGCDPTGEGVFISAMTSRPWPVQEAAVERWRLLRAHILAGLRLHRNLVEEAVLDRHGKVVHAEGEARETRALDALRERARHIDRARSAEGRRDPEAALRVWQGLVNGRWSLVDKFDSDGRRYLIARRNEPGEGVAALRPLSRRERQILAYAALGYANKHIAYTLGLAPSTVSSHLRSAMRRVGASTRAALADLWAPAVQDER